MSPLLLDAAEELVPSVGTAAACRTLGLNRSSFYRYQSAAQADEAAPMTDEAAPLTDEAAAPLSHEGNVAKQGSAATGRARPWRALRHP